MIRDTKSWKRFLFVIAVGAVSMTLSARIDVPMVPVPMTLQTFMAFCLAGVLGSRLGVMILVVYLLAACLGLPVLSGGKGGLEVVLGPSFGYLIGMVIASALVGSSRGRAMLLATWTSGLGLLVFAHAIVLISGLIRLSRLLDTEDALTRGVLPFLPGALVKSLLAWSVIRIIDRVKTSRESHANRGL